MAVEPAPVRAFPSSDPALSAILERHPRVELDAAERSPVGELWFRQGTGARKVVTGPGPEIFGLIELMDNNPMVCADVIGVPSAAGTLALIGLGPLARAGLLLEEPAMVTNAPGADAEAALATEGWTGGLTLSFEEKDLDGVFAAHCMAVVATPTRMDDLDDLYEEAYGRSFFVRREESEEWHTRLVKGTPRAAYRLGVSGDDTRTLVSIWSMADANGKCGAAQLVHAMNVMAGFEESLGLGG